MLEMVSTPTFWLLYFALLLLLLMLGETYLGLYVMVIIAIFMQIFLHKRAQSPNHPWYKVSVGFTTIFFGWLLISSIFSISWPLSFQAIFEWIFVFNLFFWFLEAPWDEIDQRFWLLGMLMLGLVLAVLGVVALLLPQYSYLIPGMNLIYPTYGHNHLGVVLLMTIPMFWAAAKEWPSPLTRTLAVVFNFTPALTFGRVIMGLAALQLFFIHQRFLRQSKLVWWLIRLAGAGMLLVIVMQMALGWYVDQGHACPVPKFQNQVCKSWNEERRSWYFEQAVAGFKEKMWTGTGPGTFGLVSEKHRQLPTFSSGFAHNDYLQFFVEYGVAGGLMLCVSFFWLLLTLRPTPSRGQNDPLYQGIYWGIAFVGINSFFDFDLNFNGVLAMQLMGLGLLSKWARVQPWPKKLSLFDTIVIWWRRWFHITALSLMVIIALLFATTNILLDQGKVAMVIQYFPYFNWQSKLMYEKLPELPHQLQNRFRMVYWHHASLITMPQERIAMTSVETERFKHIFEIDPWSRLQKEVYSYYMNRGDSRNAEIELLAANDFFMRRFASGYGRENVSNEVKDSMANALMWLADLQFQQGRLIAGARSMVAAQSYVDWVLNDSPYCNSLPLLYHQTEDDIRDVYQEIEVIPKKYFGKCRPDYAHFYLKLYSDELEKNDCQFCVQYITEAVRYEAWAANSFWDEIFPKQYQPIAQAVTENDLERALTLWRRLLISIRAIETEIPQDIKLSPWGDGEKRSLVNLEAEIEPKLVSLDVGTQIQVRQELREDARWLSQTLD